MAWEQRGKRSYYYRSRRIGGRPRHVYVGAAGSAAAELAAAVDGLRRRQREAEARRLKAEQELFQAADAPLADLCELTTTLARAALLAAGYHRHDRGKWRRRHEPRHADGNRAAG